MSELLPLPTGKKSTNTKSCNQRSCEAGLLTAKRIKEKTDQENDNRQGWSRGRFRTTKKLADIPTKVALWQCLVPLL
jgi:hypothetical protein